MRTATAEVSTPKPILVVDDNEDVRDALATYLRMEGFEIVTAQDGAAALRLLQQGDAAPCLILLDYHMPVLDGIGFRHQQLADPEIAEIPVILYSGAYDIRAKAKALDVPHVFQKPLDLHELVTLAHRYCDGGNPPPVGPAATRQRPRLRRS